MCPLDRCEDVCCDSSHCALIEDYYNNSIACIQSAAQQSVVRYGGCLFLLELGVLMTLCAVGLFRELVS